MMKPSIDLEKARAHLSGPIGSVGTPFTPTGDIDFKALRNEIDFLIAGGNPTILLTLGDSLYTLLTDEEVAEVTKVAVEHASGRAMVVAADKPWGTPKAVKFAEYAREIGADIMMVTPPDWAASCTSQAYVEHYAAVGRHLPVMLVTAVFIPRGIEFALQTIRKVLDRVDTVVAIKDDFCGEFGRKMAMLVYERWAVYSGGLKQNHLDIYPYGCDGYLSAFMRFYPAVAKTYWNAIQQGNLKAARRVIQDFEIPLFDCISSLPGGYGAGMHGISELCGITGRWRRPPYHSLTDAEMEPLSELLRHFHIPAA